MKNRLRTAGLVALALVLAPVMRAETRATVWGQTSVTLNSGFVSALSSLGLTPGILRDSTLAAGKATFPVTGGAVDLQTARGEISHSGGLTLTAGSTQVQLQSFTIDTTGTPVLTGLVTVNGGLIGRVPLFHLQLPPALSLPITPSADGVVSLKGVGLSLTDGAAAALNGVFNTTALQDGLAIGTANVFTVFDGYNGDEHQ